MGVSHLFWLKKLFINPLSANITKWSNTLKQFVSNLSTNCLSVFEYFVRLALKELKELCKKNWNQLRLRNSDLIYGIKFWIYQETKWWKADAYQTEPHSDLSRISKMAHFAKIINGWEHLRCLTGFWMHLHPSSCKIIWSSNLSKISCKYKKNNVKI